MLIMQVDPGLAREFSQFGPVWLLLGVIILAGLVAGYYIVRSWTKAAELVATAHKEFLDATRSDLRTMATAYHQQTEILREMQTTSRRIEDKLDRRNGP